MSSKICLICQNSYKVIKSQFKTSKYCSRKCKNKSQQKQRIKKICLCCKKEYFILKSAEILGRGLKYCSGECAGKMKAGENNPRYRIEGDTVCEFCKNKFHRKKSHHGKKTFCSLKCYYKYNELLKEKIICKECNVEFIAYKKDNQTFCSSSCFSRDRYRQNGQMNKGIQRGTGGKRKDLNNLYVRSSWEANYARYLNFLIKHGDVIDKWEYEPDTFEFHKIKKGTRFYTPDFKVYFKNGNIEYHEVKGWMDERSKTKLKRMSKYYPEIKILIIDKIWFRKNGKELSKIVACWEKKY